MGFTGVIVDLRQVLMDQARFFLNCRNSGFGGFVHVLSYDHRKDWC